VRFGQPEGASGSSRAPGYILMRGRFMSGTDGRIHTVGPGGFTSIGDAIAAADDGDTVLVLPGRYEDRIVVEGKSIVIQGAEGQPAPTIACATGPAITLRGGAVSI
jgi:hypothetical protein